MAVDFRGHPMFAPGFNSPTRFEADVYDCEVWGKIPSDIEGTFYRVQCDFQYRPPQNEWPTGFNGDGHVSAFRFANGSVDFKSRYVKTDRLMAEHGAVGAISHPLFTDYVIPFEITGVLLLVAIVGALALAKKSV